MNEPQIRVAARGDDLPVVAAFRRTWDVRPEVLHAAEDSAAFDARFSEWFCDEQDRRTLWVAWAGDEPIGLAGLLEYRAMPTPDLPQRCWGYVGNMYVAAAHRNRGLGARLLATVLAAADDRGYRRVVLAPSARGRSRFTDGPGSSTPVHRRMVTGSWSARPTADSAVRGESLAAEAGEHADAPGQVTALRQSRASGAALHADSNMTTRSCVTRARSVVVSVSTEGRPQRLETRCRWGGCPARQSPALRYPTASHHRMRRVHGCFMHDRTDSLNRVFPLRQLQLQPSRSHDVSEHCLSARTHQR